MKVCKNCYRISRDSDKFCVKCGKNIEEIEAVSYENEEKHYCHRCDAAFCGGVFCPLCGRDYRDGKNLISGDNAIDLRSAQVGAQVDFGSYYFDYLSGEEPINWIIIDKNEEGALLVSKYIIDCKRFNNKKQAVNNWGDSDIRKWLNGVFLSLAFEKEERERIIPVILDKEPDMDFLFLLNSDETQKYKSYLTLYAPTPFAKEKKLSPWADWWLRDTQYSMPLSVTGREPLRNCPVNPTKTGVGVRPALWVKY
ncbi:MAG: hypothetical protein J6B45_02860 [Clostridia bacterium]|nr:hypothetical protein [Clostridia bacterium]